MKHIRTVEYQRVKCSVCDYNILRRLNNILREDHSQIPEEFGSDVADHIHKELEKPLSEFDIYSSVFYCKDCGSIFHHSVVMKEDPENREKIERVWEIKQEIA